MTNAQEQLARRYLLGQLPAAEQEALETAFFTEPARLDEVWAAENQLVDDYVRGHLGRTEQAQFEQHYLDSPPHRERVALARKLLKAVDETAAAQTTAHAPAFWASLWAFLRGPQLAWGIALAALLLLSVGGTQLWRERAQLRSQLAAAQTTQQQRERDWAEQLAAARAQPEQRATAPATPAPAIPSASPPPAKPPTVFAFVLSASLLRGGGAPQALNVPRDASQVELRMRLETSDYAVYQASLRTVEGAAVWQRGQLKPRAGQLAVTVPAHKLRAGDYILTLTGVSATGAVEEVNRYFFRASGR
ncbi:MAG: hypothetical protein HYR56_09695 [Acidobacteria bacterium]|nr:hypothetical protein [Acidobacteriota bacterium]MBI3424958.1 hypothetical protein [Acidobacteriota bacterium]